MHWHWVWRFLPLGMSCAPSILQLTTNGIAHLSGDRPLLRIASARGAAQCPGARHWHKPYFVQGMNLPIYLVDYPCLTLRSKSIRILSVEYAKKALKPLVYLYEARRALLWSGACYEGLRDIRDVASDVARRGINSKHGFVYQSQGSLLRAKGLCSHRIYWDREDHAQKRSRPWAGPQYCRDGR